MPRSFLTDLARNKGSYEPRRRRIPIEYSTCLLQWAAIQRGLKFIARSFQEPGTATNGVTF